MEEDHLKLEETCVIVTGDDLQLIPKEIGNLKVHSFPLPLKNLSLFSMHLHSSLTSIMFSGFKKTRRQGFSLSKKSARKQEYKELAMWHGNSEKVKGVPSVSESEWELL
jgi:hypothetical protein